MAIIEDLVEGLINRALEVVTAGPAAIAHQFKKAIETLVEETFLALTFAIQGQYVLSLVGTVFEEGAEQLKPLLLKIVTNVLGDSTVETALSNVTGFDAWTQAASGVGDYYFKKILDFETVTGSTPVDNAKALAGKFVGLNLLLGVNSWIYEMLGETLSIGHLRSIGRLPLAVTYSLGLNRLTRFYLQGFITTMVGDPLKEAALEAMLPNKLTEGQVIDMALQGASTLEEYKDSMHRLGFDDDTAAKLLNLKKKHYSEKELKQLLDYGLITEELFREGLKHLGYVEDQLDVIYPFLAFSRVYHYSEESAKEALVLYENGKLDADRVTAILKLAFWQEIEIEAALQFADLKKLRNTLDVAQILEAHKYKLMSDGDVISRLEHVGYSESDAQILLNIEKSKEAPKPVKFHMVGSKPLSEAQILSAYQQGIFDLNKTVSYLQEWGLTQEDINVLLALHPPK